MTEPFDRLDDLASAHLDRVTTAREDQEIAQDSEVEARIDAMRRVRNALRSSTQPTDPDRRDRAISAALAAFDDLHRGGSIEPTGVTRLASGRSLSPRARILSAAAAVLLLAALVPALARLGRDDSNPTTAMSETTDASRSPAGSAAQPSADNSAGGGASAPALESRTALGGSADSAAAPVELGSFADTAQLAQGVSAYLRDGLLDVTASTTTTALPDPTVRACLTRSAEQAPSNARVVLSGTARVGGRVVTLVVVDHFDQDRVERRLSITDPAEDCHEVASATLDP